MNNIDRTPLRWKCADSISILELYLPELEIYKVYNLTDQLIPIVNSESALGSARCENGEEILQTIFMMESTPEGGIIGSYDVDSASIEEKFDETLRVADVRLTDANFRTSRKRRQALFNGDLTNGVEEPIVCLTVGDIIAFWVSTESYPVYDPDSILNTNEDFDYGGFRRLDEIVGLQEGASELFTFAFESPGTYAFHMKNDTNSRFYITVKDTDSDCPGLFSFLHPG